MIRASLRFQVAAFAVLGIVVCFSVSFAVALWFPTPPPRQVSVAEAVQALQASEVPPDWCRSIIALPPFETASQGPDIVIRAGLASELGLRLDQVRVRSLRAQTMPAHSDRAINASPGRTLSDRGNQMAARLALAPGTRFSLFSVAVQRDAGDWIHLTPKTPLLSPERLRMLTALAIAAGLIIPLAVWGCSRLTAPFRRLELAAADDTRLDSALWVGGRPRRRAPPPPWTPCVIDFWITFKIEPP